MATLFNTKISATYPGLVKTTDNAAISATLKQLTDGSGNNTGLYVNTAGDFKVTAILEWGSLKDTGTGVTITQFVTQANGISNFDNDTTIPTSAAVKDYVDTKFSQTDTLTEVLGFGNTTSGKDIAVSANDDITFTDSSKILMGAGSDLQIYHDGSNSYIDDTGTGDLKIRGETNVYIAAATGGANMAQFTKGGAVKLRYNDSNKFETTNTGASVTGNLVVSGTITGSGGSFLPLAGGTMTGNTIHNDNVKSIYGTSSDGLEIYHNGNSFIDESGTGDLYLRSSDNMYFQTYGSGKGWITLTENAGVDLFFNDVKKLETTSAGATVSGDLTVTGSITGSGGSFLPLAGGTMTGNTIHNDNVKSIYGAGSDLQIYHDGTNSYIETSTGSTGDLYIKAQGTGHELVLQATDDVLIRPQGGNNGIKVIGQGAVELYYDNSKKFETTSSGIKWTGDALNGTNGNLVMGTGQLKFADTGRLFMGDSDDLEIYHDGSNSYIKDTSGTGELIIDTNAFRVRSANGGENMIRAYEDGAAVLSYNSFDKLQTTNTGISVTGNVSTTGNVAIPDAGQLQLGAGNDAQLYHNDTSFTLRNNKGDLSINQGAVTQSIVFRVSDANSLDTTALTISRNADASFGRDVTIAGDLTVNGTTTTINTQTLAVEDPLIEMAKDNSANSVDIGFYGKYNDGTARYLGLFADASDSNKFKLFKGTTAQPTTTVDTGGTGFSLADLIVNNLTASGSDTAILSETGLTLSRGNVYLQPAASNSTTLNIGQSSVRWGHLKVDASDFEVLNGGNRRMYINSSGVTTFTGNVGLADAKVLYLGDSLDLQLFHESDNSFISNNVGHLTIRNLADDKDIIFQSDNGSGGTTTYFSLDGSANFTIFEVNTLHLDNISARFGNGEDLKIYHDGSASNIVNETGNLLIEQKADDGDIIFYSDDGSGNVTQYFRVDGGAGETFFSRNTRHLDSVYAQFGTATDLKIYHDGSDSFIQNSTGSLVIEQASGAIALRPKTGENGVLIVEDGAVSLYYDASVKLATTNTGITVTGEAIAGSVTSNAGLITSTSAGDSFLISKSTSTTGRGFIKSIGDTGSVLFSAVYGSSSTGTLFSNSLTRAAVIVTTSDTTTHPTSLLIGTFTAVPLILGTNNTERIRIDSTGYSTFNKYIKLDDPSADATGRQIHFVAISGESNTEPFRITRWQDKMYFTYGDNSGDEAFWVNSDGTVNFEEDVTVSTGLYPDADLGAELGSSSLQFSTLNTQVVKCSDNMYVSGGQLYIGALNGTTNDTFRTAVTSGAYKIESRESGTWTQRLMIDTVGDVTIAGNIFASSGVYLGGTGAANKLDDYEEGTWTPTILDLASNAATLSTANGSYTKIGRVVVLNYQIEMSSKGSMTGNYVLLGGIPFNHPAEAYNGSGMVDKFNNLSIAMSGLAWDSSSTVNVFWLQGVVAAGSTSSFYPTVAYLSDTTKMKGTIIYQTDV